MVVHDLLVICHVLLLLTLAQAIQLRSNTSVACPDETVSFTCSAPGANVWTLTPRLGDPVFRNIFSTTAFIGQGFMVPYLGQILPFIVNDNHTDNVSSTFTININNSSLLEGSSIECLGGNREIETLNITIADPPSSPLNPNVSSLRNDVSSSTLTVEWDPPSSPGGVPVSYVLTISPPPLSQSPLTVETTSAQITVSYNIRYNLTIRADNCAGTSGDTNFTFALAICPSSPTPATNVIINGVPSMPVEKSILTFTCNGQDIFSSCGRDGQWSPDPETYNCSINCETPEQPVNGSVSVEGQSPHPLGSNITYSCEDRLLPIGVLTSTCTDVGKRGLWVPDPAQLMCRVPVNCRLPEEPQHGFIVDYCNLATTEGSVITFQCDPDFSPAAEMIATCNSSGQWNTDPSQLVCTWNNNVGSTNFLSTGQAVGITVVVSFIVSVLIGLAVGVGVPYLVMHGKTRKTVHVLTEAPPQQQQPTPGPLYEEVAPAKEEIELKTNEAYGPVGQ